MPNLRIGLAKRSLDSGHGDAGLVGIEHGIVARLRRVKDGSGQEVTEAEFEVVVPAGQEVHEVDVAPGLWLIDLFLPSGEIISQQRRVDDQDRDVHLKAGPAPYDWMSWSRLEGDVPAESAYSAQLRSGLKGLTMSPRGIIPGTSITKSRPRGFHAGGGARPRKASRSRAGGLEKFAGSPTSVLRRESVVTLLQAPPENHSDPGFDWSRLLSSLERRSDGQQFIAGVDFSDAGSLKKVGGDDWFEAWRLPLGDYGLSRRFAVVRIGSEQELVVLPSPWPTDQGQGMVQLTVDVSEASRPFRSSTTVMDMRYGGLLSYLKSRRLALARTIVEQGIGLDDFEETLRDKESNALAAAAATYCLLGSTDLSEKQRWFEWVERLRHVYSWIPDGAILHARLLEARGAAADEVKAAYIEALHRGLPFFSLGVSWLRDGLRSFAQDPRLREFEPSIRQVGLRTDMAQVFTVLRFS